MVRHRRLQNRDPQPGERERVPHRRRVRDRTEPPVATRPIRRRKFEVETACRRMRIAPLSMTVSGVPVSQRRIAPGCGRAERVTRSLEQNILERNRIRAMAARTRVRKVTILVGCPKVGTTVSHGSVAPKIRSPRLNVLGGDRIQRIRANPGTILRVSGTHRNSGDRKETEETRDANPKRGKGIRD
jgi:hypothetical protein